MSLAPLPHTEVNLQQVREQLDAHGACWLSGLDASTPASILSWAEQLGSWDLGIDEELLGPRLMHLRLDQEKLPLANQPTYFTADEFPLHTDVSYVPNPPGLMLMHCVQPDPAGGGQVRLAECDAAFQLLSEEVAISLEKPVFRFLYPPACPQGGSEPAPILEQGRWRFKINSMQFTAEYSAAVDAFYQALLSVSEVLMLRKGDLLVVDNHRMAHGRTAFVGTDRHFTRCYVNPWI